jgi:hypothetical protein
VIHRELKSNGGLSNWKMRCAEVTTEIVRREAAEEAESPPAAWCRDAMESFTLRRQSAHLLMSTKRGVQQCRLIV